MCCNSGRKRSPTVGKMPYRQRYSVYRKQTDMPLIIYATAAECAAAMGIKRNSFYRYIVRMRQGKIKLRKWAMYADEADDLQEETTC